ncbi:hypothetical protein EDD11_005851 [Mortierella claussenii]|nr:hypothetical protein EDD11_005851 [Mortierella claussenii]
MNIIQPSIDMELGQLPRRETDNAVIIENATRMYKLHASPGEVKIVKSLLIAYETTPHLKGGAYTYIVQGALSEIQGVPHDDWELGLPRVGEEQDNDTADRDHDHGHDTEMLIRMEDNQDAAAKARAFLAASVSASS